MRRPRVGETQGRATAPDAFRAKAGAVTAARAPVPAPLQLPQFQPIEIRSGINPVLIQSQSGSNPAPIQGQSGANIEPIRIQCRSQLRGNRRFNRG
jgi:hypothetical protein